MWAGASPLPSAAGILGYVPSPHNPMTPKPASRTQPCFPLF